MARTIAHEFDVGRSREGACRRSASCSALAELECRRGAITRRDDHCIDLLSITCSDLSRSRSRGTRLEATYVFLHAGLCCARRADDRFDDVFVFARGARR